MNPSAPEYVGWPYAASQIPAWCGMHESAHKTCGGCLGIQYGYVRQRGEDYCKTCDEKQTSLTNPEGDLG